MASQSEREAEHKVRHTTDFVGRYPWGALAIFGIILVLVYSLLFSPTPLSHLPGFPPLLFVVNFGISTTFSTISMRGSSM